MSEVNEVFAAMLSPEQAKEEWRKHVLDLTQDIPELVCAIQIGGVGCLPLGAVFSA